jgi:hypothetical protein
MNKKSNLEQISSLSYASQILLKLGYSGIEYNNSVVIFDPSNIEIITVSINPFSQKEKKQNF